MLGSSREADLTGPGALTLDPYGVAEVRHVIGAIGWPSGEPVAELRRDGDAIEIRGDSGALERVPFRARFLAPRNNEARKQSGSNA